MKKKNLKLTFIEKGKLTNNLMRHVVGGEGSCSWVYCSTLTSCDGGTLGKNNCTGGYESCTSTDDKNNCINKYSYVISPIITTIRDEK